MRRDFAKIAVIAFLTISMVPVFNLVLLPNILDVDLPLAQEVSVEGNFNVAESEGLSEVEGQIPSDFVKKIEFLQKACPDRAGIDLFGALAKHDIAQAVEEASETHGISSDLLLAIIVAESRCDQFAKSRAGAQGLMQIMPRTAQSLGVEQPYSIRENIAAGSKYISKLLEKYNGDTRLALAAYNSGPDIVNRYRGVPPFRETRRYIRKVYKYRELFEQLAQDA